MLEDARALKARGTDVVIGFVESHGRNDIRESLTDWKTVPLKRVVHRGGSAEELDVEAVLRRNPRVCVVDELAHSNAPVRSAKSAGKTFRCCSRRASTFSRP